MPRYQAVFTLDEAKDLAIVLRAGRSSCTAQDIAEPYRRAFARPRLHRMQVKMAGLLATIMVIIFMIFYYRLSGLIADLALVLNLVLLMGAMAALNATLTLPGIAGIILAIGMAVDSNAIDVRKDARRDPGRQDSARGCRRRI